MKTAEERATSAALLRKHHASIVRFKYAAAKLSGRDGYDNASNIATDLEDIVAAELEAARLDGAKVGYDRGFAMAERNRNTAPQEYVPPTSPVWSLIDLCDHNDAPQLLRHERDTLAVAIAEAALKGGVWNGKAMVGGPALVMLAQDMGEVLAERNEAGKPVVFESDPVSAKVHVLAKSWAAIPIAVRAMFTQAMWDGVGDKLAKMPSVDSDKSSALNMAYIAAVEIIHAMADLGGAAVSTAPINPYAGIVKFNDAWASLPAEWAAFPIDLRQAIIDGLFTWMRNADEFKDPRVSPQLLRACQVAEDLLDAAKHLGNGVVPQGAVFKDDVAVEAASKTRTTEDKLAPRVRKVGPKRGPLSRLESIALDLRMAADALIELDGEAQDGDSYVDTVTVRGESEPAFKGILASVGDGIAGESTKHVATVVDIGALADHLLASLPERAASNRVLCFEQIQGGVRGVVGHALPGIADIRPWTSFVGDTIAECIANIAALREVK